MKIDWKSVDKILIVRLRSIGDTVLSTPSLILLKKLLPDARIDILLEDWVAPVLEGFEAVDQVIPVSRNSSGRASAAYRIRKNRYDAVFNFHGGTTSSFLVRASGARYRIGYRHYRYPYFYTHKYSSAAEFWGRQKLHSAEQQAALLGLSGIPVVECPKSRLTVDSRASEIIDRRLRKSFGDKPQTRFAMVHPAAAYDTKRWAPSGFAAAIRFLWSIGIETVVVTTEREKGIIREIEKAVGRQLHAFSDLSLPEVTALLSKASLFLGNDSGIAHIAAAVDTPSVVIFGSSNIVHWGPWTETASRVVSNYFDCQPCPGDYCRVFGEPRCIQSVDSEQVIAALKELTSIVDQT